MLKGEFSNCLSVAVSQVKICDMWGIKRENLYFFKKIEKNIKKILAFGNTMYYNNFCVVKHVIKQMVCVFSSVGRAPDS